MKDFIKESPNHKVSFYLLTFKLRTILHVSGSLPILFGPFFKGYLTPQIPKKPIYKPINIQNERVLMINIFERNKVFDN